MTKCLICLVCWPILCCYEGKKDVDQHCSICRKKLTHQPSGGMVQVVADPNPPPPLVASRFEQVQ
jgi:hypothetical protein